MADNFGGISVTDSTVYKGIRSNKNSFNHRTELISHKNPTIHTQMNVDDRDKNWTFLQKLLEIEEVHDKKRMTVEGRVVSEKENVGYDHVDSDMISDVTSRWIHGQILDDEDGPYGCKDDELHVESFNLPMLDTCNQPQSTRPESSPESSTRLPNIQREHNLANSSSRSVIGNSLSTVQKMSQTNSKSESSTQIEEDFRCSSRHRRKRPLRLPPIFLPNVYTVTPRPLQYREFLTPTKMRGPISESEWEDLKDCRYIRHALPRYSLKVSPSNISLNNFL